MLEYCEGGDLSHFIKSYGPLEERVARRFLRQLASGLQFMRDRNLMHRDLKPQNLLLTSRSHDADLKIADFGFARFIDDQTLAATLCGSPLYMAPEILRQNKYDVTTDLWSVGAIIFEMLTGRPPWSARTQVELLKNIESKEPDWPAPSEMSSGCLELVRSLLQRDPSKRLTWAQFFAHPYVGLTPSSMPPVSEDSVSGTDESDDGSETSELKTQSASQLRESAPSIPVPFSDPVGLFAMDEQLVPQAEPEPLDQPQSYSRQPTSYPQFQQQPVAFSPNISPVPLCFLPFMMCPNASSQQQTLDHIPPLQLTDPSASQHTRTQRSTPADPDYVLIDESGGSSVPSSAKAVSEPIAIQPAAALYADASQQRLSMSSAEFVFNSLGQLEARADAVKSCAEQMAQIAANPRLSVSSSTASVGSKSVPCTLKSALALHVKAQRLFCNAIEALREYVLNAGLLNEHDLDGAFDGMPEPLNEYDQLRSNLAFLHQRLRSKFDDSVHEADKLTQRLADLQQSISVRILRSSPNIDETDSEDAEPLLDPSESVDCVEKLVMDCAMQKAHDAALEENRRNLNSASASYNQARRLLELMVAECTDEQDLGILNALLAEIQVRHEHVASGRSMPVLG